MKFLRKPLSHVMTGLSLLILICRPASAIASPMPLDDYKSLQKEYYQRKEAVAFGQCATNAAATHIQRLIALRRIFREQNQYLRHADRKDGTPATGATELIAACYFYAGKYYDAALEYEHAWREAPNDILLDQDEVIDAKSRAEAGLNKARTFLTKITPRMLAPGDPPLECHVSIKGGGLSELLEVKQCTHDVNACTCNPIYLPDGTYSLTASAKSYKPAQKTIEIESEHEPRVVEFYFAPIEKTRPPHLIRFGISLSPIGFTGHFESLKAGGFRIVNPESVNVSQIDSMQSATCAGTSTCIRNAVDESGENYYPLSLGVFLARKWSDFQLGGHVEGTFNEGISNGDRFAGFAVGVTGSYRPDEQIRVGFGLSGGAMQWWRNIEEGKSIQLNHRSLGNVQATGPLNLKMDALTWGWGIRAELGYSFFEHFELAVQPSVWNWPNTRGWSFNAPIVVTYYWDYNIAGGKNETPK